jgi:hypothetical protein
MKLMQQPETPCHDAAIVHRLAGPKETELSAAAARGILKLQFGRLDKRLMRSLAEKARVGALTDDEQAQIEAYSRVSSLLGILKSKARRALKRHGKNGMARAQ